MPCSLDETLEILGLLRAGFAEQAFQERLWGLQGDFQQRKVRGHPDAVAFFTALEELTMSVYSDILPRWGFSNNWTGVQILHASMAPAMQNDLVLRIHGEISLLLGLPRDAFAYFLQKEQEVLVFRPHGDGFVPGYPGTLQEDCDGDLAHEFWEEDLSTGELLRLGPSFKNLSW